MSSVSRARTAWSSTGAPPTSAWASGTWRSRPSIASAPRRTWAAAARERPCTRGWSRWSRRDGTTRGTSQSSSRPLRRPPALTGGTAGTRTASRPLGHRYEHANRRAARDGRRRRRRPRPVDAGHAPRPWDACSTDDPCRGTALLLRMGPHESAGLGHGSGREPLWVLCAGLHPAEHRVDVPAAVHGDRGDPAGRPGARSPSAAAGRAAATTGQSVPRGRWRSPARAGPGAFAGGDELARPLSLRSSRRHPGDRPAGIRRDPASAGGARPKPYGRSYGHATCVEPGDRAVAPRRLLDRVPLCRRERQGVGRAGGAGSHKKAVRDHLQRLAPVPRTPGSGAGPATGGGGVPVPLHGAEAPVPSGREAVSPARRPQRPEEHRHPRGPEHPRRVRMTGERGSDRRDGGPSRDPLDYRIPTDQKAGGSSPSGRTTKSRLSKLDGCGDGLLRRLGLALNPRPTVGDSPAATATSRGWSDAVFVRGTHSTEARPGRRMSRSPRYRSGGDALLG